LKDKGALIGIFWLRAARESRAGIEPGQLGREVGEVRRQSLLPSSSNAVSGEVKIEPVVNAANLTARRSDRVRQTP
jgi:hypothetical protein